MGLNISNADYGTDTAGIKTLKSNLSNDFSRMKKAVEGEKYTAVVNTINKYWTGADADAFIAKLKKDRSQINEQIKIYETKLLNALDSASKKFTSFQRSSASKIK